MGSETFKFSTDPQLVASDVVGLYLHPLVNAIMLCVGSKSQIQMVERTRSILPLKSGQGLEAIAAATSGTAPRCRRPAPPRLRVFLKCLKLVAKAYLPAP